MRAKEGSQDFRNREQSEREEDPEDRARRESLEEYLAEQRRWDEEARRLAGPDDEPDEVDTEAEVPRRDSTIRRTRLAQKKDVSLMSLIGEYKAPPLAAGETHIVDASYTKIVLNTLNIASYNQWLRDINTWQNKFGRKLTICVQALVQEELVDRFKTAWRQSRMITNKWGKNPPEVMTNEQLNTCARHALGPQDAEHARNLIAGAWWRDVVVFIEGGMHGAAALPVPRLRHLDADSVGQLRELQDEVVSTGARLGRYQAP